MYEPFYLPQLNQSLTDLNNIKFCVSINDKYVSPNDPTLDPLHIHDSLEIFVNVASNASFLIDGKLYDLPPGSAIIICARHVHMRIAKQAEKQKHYCIWIASEKNNPIISALNDLNGNLFIFDAKDFDFLSDLIEKLNDLQNEQNEKLEKTIYFLQIISQFIQKKNQSTVAKIPDDIQSVLDDIHSDYAKITDIKQLAARHYISLSTMNRRFKLYLGLSPKKLLDSEKLSAAAKRLSNGATVTEACFSSGFSDCSYFIALFKKKFGETPYKYKCRFIKK